MVEIRPTKNKEVLVSLNIPLFIGNVTYYVDWLAHHTLTAGEVLMSIIFIYTPLDQSPIAIDSNTLLSRGEYNEKGESWNKANARLQVGNEDTP